MGPYNYDPSLFAESGYSDKKGSVWALIENFMRSADRYVVLQGNNGIPIQPLITWSGLSSKESGKNLDNNSLPLRVDTIRLKGTDIEEQRKLVPHLETYGFLVDTSWEDETIRGKSGEGTTTVIGEKDDPVVAGIRKARRNPRLDKNKDGIVDSKDNDKAIN
jgi:hypothetical protein